MNALSRDNHKQALFVWDQQHGQTYAKRIDKEIQKGRCISRSTPVAQSAPRNLLTRWDVSSIPANGIFLTKKLKNQNKNAQRVEND